MTGCERARDAIHRRLDGDPVDAAVLEGLEHHLEACTACRELHDELSAIQGGLRALPVVPLPGPALENVLDRTVRRRVVLLRRRSFDWRLAAAAAVVFMVAFLGIRSWNPQAPPPGPSRAEVARAAREVRLVLNLTSQALQKTGNVAVKEVLAEEISPALRRVPVRWPSGRAAGERRHES